jgi:hypothetical protein
MTQKFPVKTPCPMLAVREYNLQKYLTSPETVAVKVLRTASHSRRTMSLQALAMHTLNVDDYVRKNKKAITLPAD